MPADNRQLKMSLPPGAGHTRTERLLHWSCTGQSGFRSSKPAIGASGRDTFFDSEQWPSYWVEKFSRAGFKPYDVVRPLIWTDTSVELCYYRQNILVFSRVPAFNTPDTRMDLVHPEIWQARLDYRPSAGRLLRSLAHSPMRSLRRRLALGGSSSMSSLGKRNMQ
jgi:hypothetical protein